MSQDNIVRHIKTDFRDPIAGCHYSIGGFARVKDGRPFLIIEGHSVTESGKKVGAICSDQNVQMLSLPLMEKTAREYMQGKTDDEIFIGEAADQQTTLGFVCYEVVRRLIRLERRDDIPNYDRPLDIPALEELISEAIAKKGHPVRESKHREIPLAQDYILQRYGLMNFSKQDPALEAA